MSDGGCPYSPRDRRHRRCRRCCFCGYRTANYALPTQVCAQCSGYRQLLLQSGVKSDSGSEVPALLVATSSIQECLKSRDEMRRLHLHASAHAQHQVAHSCDEYRQAAGSVRDNGTALQTRKLDRCAHRYPSFRFQMLANC